MYKDHPIAIDDSMHFRATSLDNAKRYPADCTDEYVLDYASRYRAMVEFEDYETLELFEGQAPIDERSNVFKTDPALFRVALVETRIVNQ